jgi:hypothetical protein
MGCNPVEDSGFVVEGWGVKPGRKGRLGYRLYSQWRQSPGTGAKRETTQKIRRFGELQPLLVFGFKILTQ